MNSVKLMFLALPLSDIHVLLQLGCLLPYAVPSFLLLLAAFIFSFMKLRFGNKFFGNMQDAVDCPEWVVPFHLFKLLAEEVSN